MPWSDRPKKVERSMEKMVRVAACMSRFAGRRYFPPTEESFDALVEAVCDIVFDKEVIIAKEPWNDLEWLFKRAFARFDDCPSPRKLRVLYCEFLMPADGVAIVEEIN